MSENTKIEWTDHTFNPWEGCTKVSPGCLNCYAETRNARWNGGTAPNWGAGAPRRRTSEANWKQPLKWNREAAVELLTAKHILADEKAGEENRRWAEVRRRPRVFCASLADWLDDEVPVEWLADLLDLIRLTPNLDWLLLTKRPENFRPRLLVLLDAMGSRLTLEESYLKTFVSLMQGGWQSSTYTASDVGRENYWIGTTVEDQKRADERIPALLSIPAKVRFLSCEPLLEAVVLRRWMGTIDKPGDWYPWNLGIHWIIAGGESGPCCRAFDPDWARSLRDECAASGVPFFMKQMGGTRKPFSPIPEDLMIREFPTP